MIELQLFHSNFEMVLLYRVFINELKAKGVSDEDIDRRIATEFQHQFRSHVSIHFFVLYLAYITL
jgi:predicted metal-dependent phosphotriesterase family hydrolase